MARIVPVEDEPSAMRYLCFVIEQKCSGFEIVDTAENGAEGLEKITYRNSLLLFQMVFAVGKRAFRKN